MINYVYQNITSTVFHIVIKQKPTKQITINPADRTFITTES